MHLASLFAPNLSFSFWKVYMSTSEGTYFWSSSFCTNFTINSLNFFIDSVYFTSWWLELVFCWLFRLTFILKFVLFWSYRSSWCEWVFESLIYYFKTYCYRFPNFPKILSVLPSTGMFWSVWYSSVSLLSLFVLNCVYITFCVRY